MREIIQLQVGQCGNQIGTKFWGTLLSEHDLDPTGATLPSSRSPPPSAFFSELAPGKFRPRAILVDLDPGIVDAVLSGPLGKLFPQSAAIRGSTGAGNNFAKGMYADGPEILDTIMDAVMTEAEKADKLEGFQITHALGGGTGSGLGALLINKLQEQFADKMLQVFSVLPSPKVSDTVVEPYNAVLCLHYLIESSNCVVHCLDNEAILGILLRQVGVQSPTYSGMNEIIAASMSGITSPMRFLPVGGLNASILKLAINLIPFSKLHFMTSCPVPICSGHGLPPTAAELAAQMFQPENYLSGMDVTRGKMLGGSAIFRGATVNRSEAEREAQRWASQHAAGWIPDQFKVCFCPQGGSTGGNSAVMCANNTAIAESFNRIYTQFGAMFRRKAFLSWYTGEGMDETQFDDTHSELADLISEYQQYSECDEAGPEPENEVAVEVEEEEETKAVNSKLHGRGKSVPIEWELVEKVGNKRRVTKLRPEVASSQEFAAMSPFQLLTAVQTCCYPLSAPRSGMQLRDTKNTAAGAAPGNPFADWLFFSRSMNY